MDELFSAGDPADAMEEDMEQVEAFNSEAFETDDPAFDEEAEVDEEAIEQASAEYLGHWNRLVSTTNWEKGRIISKWRQAMIESGMPQQAYSDEAWARRVGNVSGQHVGRLRRVYDRFGDQYHNYTGLYWSHFQAVLDWDDAEMWLEGSVQNGWSVAQMRDQRWEALGAPADKKPRPEDVIAGEFDEDSQSYEDETPSAIDGSLDVVRDPDEEDRADAEESDETVEGLPFETGTQSECEGAVSSPVRPFENLPRLPDDIQEAVEYFKLAILAHKMTGWTEVSCDDVLAALNALKQLALAPSES
ncbi:MAG: hypothetical protein ACYC6Y_24200 [Thermoguttaceae bacterium]